MKVAAITMVRNEADMLPWWVRHYSQQVSPSCCYVVDHGSTDGSTSDLGDVNVIKIPFKEFDELARAESIANLCESLLKWYDWVIYSDVDEILLADPGSYSTLHDYCLDDHPDVVTALGVNLLHRLHHEVELDYNLPILGQRRWMVGAASMAKPLLTRVPIQWPAGFHTSDAPMIFDGLTNFHLAYVDLATTWRRQVGRRDSRINTAAHHQMSDNDLYRLMEQWSEMPTIDDILLNRHCIKVQSFIEEILKSSHGREDHTYKIDLNIWGQELWRVPQRFVNAF